MTLTKVDGFTSAFKGGLGKYTGALICGPNWELVNRLKADSISVFLHDCADGELVRLADSDVSADSGRLLEELQSLSMFGSRKLIILEASSSSVHKACIGAVSMGWSGCGLLVFAGDLKKSSPLRKEFEASPELLAVVCYEQQRQDLARVVHVRLEAASIVADADVCLQIVDSIDGNAGLLESEVAKLVEFAGSSQSLTIDDVQTVGALNEAGSVENLIDAVFIGDIRSSLHALGNLKDQGIQPASVLISMTGHFELLLQLAVVVDGGRNPASVVKDFRPPIFFKRQSALSAQLSRCDVNVLSQLVQNFQACNKDVRLNPGIAWSVTERFVMSVCGFLKRGQAASVKS